MFTPYIGSIVPSHDYAYYGHAAFGERLNEVQVGTFVAKLFTSGVPGMFVSGRVGYGFVEKVLDISHNRSIGDLEVGYFVTPSFRAFAMTNGQYTHGGIDLPVGGVVRAAAPVSAGSRRHSTRSLPQCGGGFAYSISDSFDIFGSFSRQVAGRNGHALNRGDHHRRKLEFQSPIESGFDRCRRGRTVIRVCQDDCQAGGLARPLYLSEIRGVMACHCGTIAFRSTQTPVRVGT